MNVNDLGEHLTLATGDLRIDSVICPEREPLDVIFDILLSDASPHELVDDEQDRFVLELEDDLHAPWGRDPILTDEGGYDWHENHNLESLTLVEGLEDPVDQSSADLIFHKIISGLCDEELILYINIMFRIFYIINICILYGSFWFIFR